MKTVENISLPQGEYYNQVSEKVELASYIQNGPLILFFYPKDMTSGCTLEVQNFRDAYNDLQSLSANVLGVSRDSVVRHRKFIAKESLNFDLIADVDSALCEYFDVLKEKSMYGKKYIGIERSTFIFNQEGKSVAVWRGVKVKGHVEEVLAAIRDTL